MKFKRAIPHDITIVATPNGGFIVTVGCARVAYSNYDSLLQDLTEYLADPDTVKKQYMADIKKPDRVHLGHMLWSHRTDNMATPAHEAPNEFNDEPTEGPII